jgi:2-oxo-3-hexenedioate decarboxylase
MGAPEEAIAWLVRQLHTEGEWLQAGQIVFAGGLTAPFDAAAGCVYELTCPHLATVSVRFD